MPKVKRQRKTVTLRQIKSPLNSLDQITSDSRYKAAATQISKLSSSRADVDKARQIMQDLYNISGGPVQKHVPFSLWNAISMAEPPSEMAKLMMNVKSIIPEWPMYDRIEARQITIPGTKLGDIGEYYLALLRDPADTTREITGMEDKHAKVFVDAMQAKLDSSDKRGLFFIAFDKLRFDSIPTAERKHQRIAIITSIFDWGGRDLAVKDPKRNKFMYEYRGMYLSQESPYFYDDKKYKRGKHANTIIIDCQPGMPGIVCMTDASRYIHKFIERWNAASQEDRVMLGYNLKDVSGITLSPDMDEEQVAEKYIKHILFGNQRRPLKNDPIKDFFAKRGVHEIHYKVLNLPIANDDGPHCMRLALATCYFFLFVDTSYDSLYRYIVHQPFNRMLSLNTITNTKYPYALAHLVAEYLSKKKRK